MNEWEPATEAEAAMREALARSDQELYFRILERCELVLPVSPDALAGRVAMGWGTWTLSNRTHVLAFTSPYALAHCLSDQSATFRAVPFASLAAQWPNYEWWLAVNPGLPIEAYLPSWFVAQLSRGDVRLPGRTMGARARIDQHEMASGYGQRLSAGAATAGPAMARGTSGNGNAPSQPVSVRVTATAEQDFVGFGHGASYGRPDQDHVVETVDAEIVDHPEAGEADTVRVDLPDAPAAADPSWSAHGWAERVRGASTAIESTAAIQAGSVAGPAPEYQASENGRGASAATATPAGRTASARPDIRPDMRASDLRARAEDAEIVTPGAWADGFTPANDTEVSLLTAVKQGNTDAFVSTLLLARVIVPVPEGTRSTVRPRDADFPWRTESLDGQPHLCVYTSPQRMAERGFARTESVGASVSVRFVQLIAAWPGEHISFAINPNSPVGAKLPGTQIVALANWATEAGLRDDPAADVVVVGAKNREPTGLGVAGAPAAGAEQATVMQRTVLPGQVAYYLDRGYDRVSGFVNRASEVAHLTTPRSLYRALGLIYPGSPFSDDDDDVHVLRWVAHRSGLYRLPYGGPHEAAMRAMQGWVIERSPFRGNGFAPGDSEVIAEFKVDSVRLPHGAQMWRFDKVGGEALVATFDADAGRWVPAAGYYGGRYA